MGPETKLPVPSKNGWTFLSNHAHVLLCIARDPLLRVRDIATMANLTERAVMSIVSDLEESGYLTRMKEGRRNRYSVMLKKPLRHPLEQHTNIAELFSIILGDK